MEISVGFADKDEAYYLSKGYVSEESEIGRVYYPKAGVEVTGEIVVRREEHPWITNFEVDGIAPKKMTQEERDVIMHSEMMLTYINRHGSIDKDEAARLCKMTPIESEELLERLVGEKYLSKEKNRYISNMK